MKKFITAILAILYISTSTGATVQLHYCMGKLSGWSLTWTETHPKECGKCGMEKKDSKGCCHDENKFLKIQDDQKANYVSLEILKISVAAPAVADHSLTYSLPKKDKLLPESNAPPRRSDTDICIRNCVFRI